MFLCKECHTKLGCECLHTFISRGPCEICKIVNDCFDCRPYRAKDYETMLKALDKLRRGVYNE